MNSPAGHIVVVIFHQHVDYARKALEHVEAATTLLLFAKPRVTTDRA